MSDYISEARLRAAASLQAASIALTPLENDAIEVADFGLGRHAETGLQLLTYVNSERYCANGRCQTRRAVWRCLRGALRSSVSQARIVTLCGPTSDAVRDGTRPFPRQPQFG